MFESHLQYRWSESNRWVRLRSVTISGYSRQISPAPQAALLSFGMRGTMSLTGVQKIKNKNSIKWKCFPTNSESEKKPIFITFNCFISIELIANACTLPHFQRSVEGSSVLLTQGHYVITILAKSPKSRRDLYAKWKGDHLKGILTLETHVRFVGWSFYECSLYFLIFIA